MDANGRSEKRCFREDGLFGCMRRSSEVRNEPVAVAGLAYGCLVPRPLPALPSLATGYLCPLLPLLSSVQVVALLRRHRTFESESSASSGILVPVHPSCPPPSHYKDLPSMYLWEAV